MIQKGPNQSLSLIHYLQPGYGPKNKLEPIGSDKLIIEKSLQGEVDNQSIQNRNLFHIGRDTGANRAATEKFRDNLSENDPRIQIIIQWRHQQLDHMLQQDKIETNNTEDELIRATKEGATQTEKTNTNRTTKVW